MTTQERMIQVRETIIGRPSSMKGVIVLVVICSLVLISPGCGIGSDDPSEVHVDASDSLRVPSWVDAEVLDSVQEGIRESEAAGEVPIGAVCIVVTGSGRRIFVGSNAMKTQATGHAEIMALQSAIDALGADAISPEETYLVTSFEPCPMCTAVLGDIWKLDPSNVAVLMPKKPEWRNAERRAVDAMRAGWILTRLEEMQREAFCRDPGYVGRYPGDCE